MNTCIQTHHNCVFCRHRAAYDIKGPHCAGLVENGIENRLFSECHLYLCQQTMHTILLRYPIIEYRQVASLEETLSHDAWPDSNRSGESHDLAHTDQLNCCLCNDAVLRQDTPIFLQSLSIQKKLLPLFRCVGGEGFCLEILDHIEPWANSQTDYSSSAI